MDGRLRLVSFFSSSVSTWVKSGTFKTFHIPVPKVSLSGVDEEDTYIDVLDDFVKPVKSGACLVLANAEFFVIPKPVVLPPGYNPVFRLECLGGAGDEELSEMPTLDPPEVTPSAPLLKPFVSDSSKQARFEAYQLLIRQGLSRKSSIIHPNKTRAFHIFLECFSFVWVGQFYYCCISIYEQGYWNGYCPLFV